MDNVLKVEIMEGFPPFFKVLDLVGFLGEHINFYDQRVGKIRMLSYKDV
jgi:hypothetical protein